MCMYMRGRLLKRRCRSSIEGNWVCIMVLWVVRSRRCLSVPPFPRGVMMDCLDMVAVLHDVCLSLWDMDGNPMFLLFCKIFS